ncbi:Plant transposon protein [Fragilaria crotonensis]|nr:Plant transposon protein [Fragilaria crotonensis]
MTSPFTTYTSFDDMLLSNTGQGQEESDDNSTTSDDDATNKSAVDFVDRMVEAIMTTCVIPSTKNMKPASVPINRRRIINRRRRHKPILRRKYGSGAMIWTNPVDGTTCRLTPYMSQWYNYYIKNPPLDDDRFLRKFRRRFRVPHSYFVELAAELEETEDFQTWKQGSTNCYGVPATPIPLLLLAVLRYLGRAWTLDDLSENTCTSQESVRRFLHKFLEFGSTTLFQRYVLTPSCADEAEQHMAEYSDAGFPGAVGSTDATHVILERIPNKHRQSHLGFKSTHTARAYNITVNHRRQILATTTGHPARWNDKTLAIFDPFMQGLHEGKILDDLEFDLYEYNDSGDIVMQRYCGGWLLVDNGYLARPTTVPPIKTTTSRKEIRFSGWLEALRKDVECTFGILKGRWRILKTGIRIHGTDGPDKVFFTCCALHNKLLHIDGLHTQWEDGVRSVWENEYDNDDGDNDIELEDEDEDDDIPDAIVRLRNPVSERNFGIGELPSGSNQQERHEHRAPAMNTTMPIIPASNNNIIVVRKLALDDFRSRLVEHFSIAVARNEVK